MPHDHFAVEMSGTVAVCTFRNPPKNLMTAAAAAELDRITEQLAADDLVHAVVITGGIEGVFVQHYDVAELLAGSQKLISGEAAPPSTDELHTYNRALLRLQTMPKGTVAAINGTALGGGFELALACDIRIAVPDALIGLPEANLGILPGSGGTQRLARLAGAGAALQYIALGGAIEAQNAYGLVQFLARNDQLLEESIRLAGRLASRPGVAIAQIKRCINEGLELPLVDGLKLEQHCFFETLKSPHALAAMRKYVDGGQIPDDFLAP